MFKMDKTNKDLLDSTENSAQRYASLDGRWFLGRMDTCRYMADLHCETATALLLISQLVAQSCLDFFSPYRL